MFLREGHQLETPGQHACADQSKKSWHLVHDLLDVRRVTRVRGAFLAYDESSVKYVIFSSVYKPSLWTGTQRVGEAPAALLAQHAAAPVEALMARAEPVVREYGAPAAMLAALAAARAARYC